MAVGLKIVEGDFIINPSGSVAVVEQNEKCSRDFGKMLVTSKEFIGNTTSFDRYNSDYGTELENRSMYFGLSRMSIRDVVILLLNQAISNYLKLQEGRNNLDYGEVITEVDFNVYYDVQDLRNLMVDIKFKTALGGGYITAGQFIQALG